MNKSEFDLVKEQPNDGAVIYTDGGARPNPGFIGFGFHGYLYKDEKPKKGCGNPKYFPSAYGYMQKDEKSKADYSEVTPQMYFDGYGCQTTHGTNNLAELLALSSALNKIAEYKPKNVLVRTDSEYVKRGVEDWSNSWIRNNWIKQDGRPVPYSDKWKEVLSKLTTIREEGTQFKIEWVKGHSDYLGNNLADKLATIGVMASTSGESRIEVKTHLPEKYWKVDADIHPMITHRRLYFNTLRYTHIPGEYYLGDHGKDDELLGRRMSDGSYAVIRISEPDPVIELVKKYQTEKSGDMDAIVMVRLDELFSKETYPYILEYGQHGLVRPTDKRLDLYGLSKEPLTRELRPQRLAGRAIEILSTLKDILDKYQSNKLDNMVVQDITDLFYTKEVIKKKKTEEIEVKLRTEIGSGFVSMPVNCELESKSYKIVLTLGIDIPKRNSLKSMEDPNIKVKLLVWKESDLCYRYATVFENGRDFGVWCGWYSNLIFIKNNQ